MAVQLRSNLRNSFTAGKRPKQQEFWDWLDSFYHKTEDAIKTTGWQFRSFFKDLRADGVTFPAAGITSGTTIIDIPFGATTLKKIRVFGRATATVPPFTISVVLTYFSDLKIISLSGVNSTGNPFPTAGFFAHFLTGPASIPLLTFNITTAGPEFSQVFDFVAVGKIIPLDFTQVRFLALTISIANGKFSPPDPNYVYYGFEYE